MSSCVIPTDKLLRAVGPGEIADYRRDGATIVRRILPPSWIEALRDATDRCDPTRRACAVHGPGVDLARQVLAPRRRLNLYLDRMVSRQIGSREVTPFHQDLPYLGLTGNQILRLWIPLDAVDVGDGATHYLKGSHRGPIYRSRGFEDSDADAAMCDTAGLRPIPDFAAEYRHHEWLIGACEPGDVILQNPRVVHGNPANVARSPRRAATLIYTGDDVRVDCALYPPVWERKAS